MSEWRRGDTWGGVQQSCRRIEGYDRVSAIVHYDTPFEDEEFPPSFDWTIQDGADGGRVIERGYVDGEQGLAAAQRAADEAAARLYPEPTP